MRLLDHDFTPEEERLFFAVFDALKQVFPKTRIDERKDVIGIGEEGRLLFCYFSLRDGALRVKFKNLYHRDLTDEDAVWQDLRDTVTLFQAEALPVAARHPKERAERNYDSMLEDFALYEKACQQIPEEKTAVGFSPCSNRLKNVFAREGIQTVKDLLALSPLQIMQFPSFGKTCFWELYDYLLSLQHGDAASAAPPSERLQRGERIQVAKKAVRLSPEEAFLHFNENSDAYAALYHELIEYVHDAATAKLPPRECAILLARFGINEAPKTMQEIGDAHGLTRERIRQLLKKATQKLGSARLTSEESMALEDRRATLVSKICIASPSGFLAFLLLQESSESLLRFVCENILHSGEDPAAFRDAVRKELSEQRRHDKDRAKSKAFNESILRKITFPSRVRHITEADFARLKEEGCADEEGRRFTFEGKTYEVSSYLEEQVLSRLLQCRTFRAVKLRALQIPLEENGFRPNFLCMTEDGRFVIVMLRSLLHMCTYYSLKKVQALRAYCEKYGFGYLITDDRGNSFEEIEEENPAFCAAILARLERGGTFSSGEYQQISTETRATVKHLLALIKKKNLYFDLPFRLKKA
jgi:DNA-binding CsgD family transcriptional regulator